MKKTLNILIILLLVVFTTVSVNAEVVGGSISVGDISFYGVGLNTNETKNPVLPLTRLSVSLWRSDGNDYSNTSMKLKFVSEDGVNSFVAVVQDITTSPYINAPVGASSDVKYRLEEVEVTSNGETEIWYTKSVENGNYYTCYDNCELTVKGGETTSSTEKDDWKIGGITFTSLQIKNVEVKPGDNVYVDLSAAGDFTNIRFDVQVSSGESDFVVSVNDLETKPYFTVPTTIKAGSKCELKYVFIWYGNEDHRSYSTFQSDSFTYMNPGENKYFSIAKASSDWQVGKILFTNLQLRDTVVSAGDKVYVDLYAGGDLSDGYISVDFKSTTDSDSFIVYLKSLQKNPYFIVPDTVKPGTKYELRGVNIFSGNESHSYNTYQVTNGTYMNPGVFKYFTVKEEEKPVTSEDILKFISFDKTSYKAGDKVNVNLNLTKKANYVSVHLYNAETTESIGAYLTFNLDGSAYFTLPETAVPGDYVLSGVVIFTDDNNYDYSKSNNLKFNVNIKIEKENTQEVTELNKVTIESTNVNIGEKSYVTLDKSENVQSVLLNFYSSSLNKNFNVYLKSLNDNPYFIVPSLTGASSYKLKFVIIKYKDSKVAVYQDSDSNNDVVSMLNQTINVSVSTVKSSYLFFDNNEVNDNVIDSIKKSSSDSIISLDANNNSFVSSDVFNAVKESRRTIVVDYGENEWVFNGTDIDTSKTIDVSLDLYSIKDVDSIDSSIVNAISNDSVLLQFPSNGELPGKVLIRIKDDLLSESMKGDKYYVYYLDEENNKLEKVALEIQKSEDGYLEFYINHNSKYVISSSKASSKVTSDSTELLELNTVEVTDKADNKNVGKDAMPSNTNTNTNNNSSNNNLIVYCCLGLCVFVIIIMFVVILRLTKTKNDII